MDWSKLKTNTGPATWVPECLEVLAAPEQSASAAARDRAHASLSKRLFKHGKWTSAAAPVTEAVLDLALGEDVPQQDRLLELAARLVAVEPSRYLVDGFDLAMPALAAVYARGTAKKVHAALEMRAADVLARLDHEDARVRSAAAYLLIFRGKAREETAAAIFERLEAETDAYATCVELLAASLIDPSVGDVVSSWIADDRPLVAGAAAIARGGPLDESLRGTLVSFMRSAPLDCRDVPFSAGRLDMWVARVIEAREGPEAAADLLLDALGEPHALGDAWAGGVLELCLTPSGSDPSEASFVTRSAVRPVEEFSLEQRARLEALCAHPWAASFASYGVPSRLADRRRWLGLDPAGVLESEHELEIDGRRDRWPLWRWLHMLQRGAQSKTRFETLGASLPPDVVLAAKAEAALGAYGLRTLPPRQVELDARALGADGIAWAHRFADALAEAVHRDAGASWGASRIGAATNPGHPVGGIALKLLVEQGEAIAERHDLLVPLGSLELFEQLPLPRREAVVVHHFERLSKAPDICTANVSYVLGPMAQSLTLCRTERVRNELRALEKRLSHCERVRSEDASAVKTALAAASD